MPYSHYCKCALYKYIQNYGISWLWALLTDWTIMITLCLDINLVTVSVSYPNHTYVHCNSFCWQHFFLAFPWQKANSLTTEKFPDISRFSRKVVTLFPTYLIWDATLNFVAYHCGQCPQIAQWGIVCDGSLPCLCHWASIKYVKQSMSGYQ